MTRVDPAAGQATVAAGSAGRGFRLASLMGALILAGVVLAVMTVDVPLARLAHQSLNASGGSLMAGRRRRGGGGWCGPTPPPACCG